MFLRRVTLLWTLLLALPGTWADDDRYEVFLTSDSPAVLDAPIIFTGRLIGPRRDSATYRWRWSDNTSPGHFNETEAPSSVTERNYTIVYPLRMYEASTYYMTLTIYEYMLLYWRQIGTRTVRFQITFGSSTRSTMAKRRWAGSPTTFPSR